MIKHLACIMDGNRRYAKQQGLLGWIGHRHGVESVKLTIDFCLKNGISYLSLYSFSLENFNRSEVEKNYLFDLLIEQAAQGVEHFVKHGIAIKFAGDRSLFPAHVLPACKQIEEQTADGKALYLTFLFCYGARQELVSSVKHLIADVKSGLLDEQSINESALKRYSWLGDIPDPELIIRTGKVKRLSNFLLFQAAYSELYFLDCYWPELTEHHLHEAVTYFKKAQRNFGQ